MGRDGESRLVGARRPAGEREILMMNDRGGGKMRTYCEPAQELPVSRDVEVVVVGGGPAGLAAYLGGAAGCVGAAGAGAGSSGQGISQSCLFCSHQERNAAARSFAPSTLSARRSG